MRNTSVVSVFFLALAAALTGCGGAHRACSLEGERTVLVAVGGERMNPDASGDPLPTIVRIYQLKDIATLEMASFEEVWTSPEQVLGESLVAEEEITLYPGTRQAHAFERNADARFVVGLAIVRQPSGSSWRSVLELPPVLPMCTEEDEAPEPRTKRVVLAVDDYRIEGTLEGFESVAPVADESCDDPPCLEIPEEPAAPEAPSAPSAPDSPSVPAPDAPSVPASESVSAPTLSSMRPQ